MVTNGDIFQYIKHAIAWTSPKNGDLIELWMFNQLK